MQTKIQVSDSVVAGMNLAAALVGLLVAALGLVYFMASRSKKERPRTITIAFQVGVDILLFAGVIAYVLGVNRLGLLFYAFAAVFMSIDYVRHIGPAERMETLMLVLSWVMTGSLAIMNEMSKMLELVRRIIDVVDR